MRGLAQEAARISDIAPCRYTIVTSRDLNDDNRSKLLGLFAPYILSSEDIIDLRNLDKLVDRNPEVEQQHYKLWLASANILQPIVHSDVFNRSLALREAIARDVPRYVETANFAEARQMLRDKHICIISGDPGIGKTTLARMLVLAAMTEGFKPVDVSADITEAEKMWRTGELQVFYYDDFLGRTTFERMLGKNEDRRLAEFIDRVVHDATKLLLLTTREYLLAEAVTKYENVSRAVEARKFILSLEAYPRRARAKILYNHLYHAAMAADFREGFLRNRGYLRIIDHRNFNPRLISVLTARAKELAGKPERMLDASLELLENPFLLWQTAFDIELQEVHRILLLILVTFPNGVTADDLARAVEATMSARGRLIGIGEYERALKVLDTTFVEVGNVDGEPYLKFANPSVDDFILAHLASRPNEFKSLLATTVFFDQVRYLWQIAHQAGPRVAGQGDFRQVADAARALFAKRLIEMLDSPAPMARYGSYISMGTPGIDERNYRTAFVTERAVDLPEIIPAVKEEIRSRIRAFPRMGRQWDGAVSIVVGCRRAVQLQDEAAIGLAGLRELILEPPEDAWGWDNVRKVLTMFRNIVTDEEFDALSKSFESYAADELESSDIPESLEELESCAALFRVSVDIRYSIEDAVTKRGEEAEEPDVDLDEGNGPPAEVKEFTDEDADAMFSRLGDVSA